MAAYELTINNAIQLSSDAAYAWVPVRDMDGQMITDETGMAIWDLTETPLSSLTLYAAANLVDMDSVNSVSDKAYSFPPVTDLAGGYITDLMGARITELTGTELSQLALGVAANLLASSGLHTLLSDKTSFPGDLVISNALSNITSDSPTLRTIAYLVAANAIQNIITAAPLLGSDLVVDDSVIEQITTETSVVIAQLVIAASSVHTLTSDQVLPLVAKLIIPNRAIHTLLSTSPLLRGVAKLLANSGVQTQKVDTITLGAVFALGVGSALNLITSTILGLGGAKDLLTNDAIQGTLSTDGYISRAANLLATNGISQTTAENIIFGLAQILGMTDAVQTQTADKLLINMLANLSAGDSLQSLTSDQLSTVFTQAVLVVATALNQQIAGQISLGGPHVLAINDASSQILDTLTLKIQQLLEINNATNLLTSQNINLVVRMILNVLHFYTAEDRSYSFEASSEVELDRAVGDDFDFTARDGLK